MTTSDLSVWFQATHQGFERGVPIVPNVPIVPSLAEVHGSTFNGIKIVPTVPDVPKVPIVEDVPEVIVLPELWGKTGAIVPDCPHHGVKRGVRRMVRVWGARRAAGRQVRKVNEVYCPRIIFPLQINSSAKTSDHAINIDPC
jgi:hypothetical protein